jgi:hypothetical protein
MAKGINQHPPEPQAASSPSEQSEASVRQILSLIWKGFIFRASSRGIGDA